jgi:hypothetical protein
VITSAIGSSSPRPKRVLRLAAITLAALALSALKFAGRADAFVYWTSPGLSTNTSGLLGRASLDGSDANDTFESNVSYPQGVAVDSADGYIYWTTNLLGGTIARAKINGTDVNEEFITGVSNPAGVAVDSADGYVYWSNSVPHGASTIGRAKLDGTGANPRFITTLLPASGVATDNLSTLGGPPPTPTIASLIADVKKLGRSPAIERRLIAKLHAAQRSLDSVHIGKARGHLGAFIDGVRAHRGKAIHAAKAKELIAKATAIRIALGCRAHHCR